MDAAERACRQAFLFLPTIGLDFLLAAHCMHRGAAVFPPLASAMHVLLVTPAAYLQLQQSDEDGCRAFGEHVVGFQTLPSEFYPDNTVFCSIRPA